jgi:hypothetical protein
MQPVFHSSCLMEDMQHISLVHCTTNRNNSRSRIPVSSLISLYPSMACNKNLNCTYKNWLSQRLQPFSTPPACFYISKHAHGVTEKTHLCESLCLKPGECIGNCHDLHSHAACGALWLWNSDHYLSAMVAYKVRKYKRMQKPAGRKNFKTGSFSRTNDDSAFLVWDNNTDIIIIMLWPVDRRWWSLLSSVADA